MVSEPTVAGVEQAGNNRQLGGCVERPRPPNLSREVNNCPGPTVNLAFGRDDAHFAEPLRGRQIEQGSHARILKGRKAKAAGFESSLESSGERGADIAVAIKADPAAAGVPSFAISHF